MIIPFSLIPNPYKAQKLYYANKQRYSSMTSVVFISASLLVCANYCLCKMYLVQFNLSDESYNVIDTIDTIGDNYKRAGPTDLIDYTITSDGTKQLVTSNFDQCSISIYNLINNDTKLIHIKSIVNKQCGPCHGISYHPTREGIVLFATTGTKNPNVGVYACDITQSTHQKPFFNLKEPGWLGKDVCFIDESHIFVLYCDSAPNPKIQRRYSSKVVLYEIDLDQNNSNKISEFTIQLHHADSCFYKNGKLYITVEGVDEPGKILIYNVSNLFFSITYDSEITGFSFPHGIDINYNMMAVTEYGNSDVIINEYLD